MCVSVCMYLSMYIIYKKKRMTTMKDQLCFCSPLFMILHVLMRPPQIHEHVIFIAQPERVSVRIFQNTSSICKELINKLKQDRNRGRRDGNDSEL